jgi:ADP-ribose pyrophosphatase YjhB (NUDIX family)
MQPVEHFVFCPRCAAPREGGPVTPFRCGACGFVFYFNPTVAAAVIITRPDGRVLFITRAKEPARGKLAFPGGFMDIGERAEDGLRREVREEVGIEIGELDFLCSHQNQYLYETVTYPVLDLLFTAPVTAGQQARALDAVAKVDWLRPEEVGPDLLAFDSLRAGWQEFLRRRRRGTSG